MKTSDYAKLSPDLVIDAVESLGFLSDARILALNSYENRVYQVGIEEAEPIVAKFYRPGRWSNAQILEEHQFCIDLAAQEIPIIAPLTHTGESLFYFADYRFALYPRRGGHAPELDDLDTLYRLGQQIGRLHAVGKTRTFTTRPRLDQQSFGHQARDYVLDCGLLPDSLREAYSSLTAHLLDKVATVFASTPSEAIRLHGDCHPGNILVRYDKLFLLDLDDARSGPAVQDLWMLISGDMTQKRAQMSSLLEGYEEFCEFDTRELRLIEALRTLRMLHYCSWLARRWEDPAFPLAFPWFNTEKYWAEHILELREQLAELDEPTLTLQG